MDAEKFLEMKHTIEDLKRERDKSKILYEQHLEDLQEKFECAGIKEATKKLISMKEEKGIIEDEFTRALKEWGEQWGDMI